MDGIRQIRSGACPRLQLQWDVVGGRLQQIRGPLVGRVPQQTDLQLVGACSRLMQEQDLQ